MGDDRRGGLEGAEIVLKWLFPRRTEQGEAIPQINYLDEARRIWQEFVPKSGQSDTVQGELLRAVEKLRDEAMRNGNGNWDEGFRILLSYLKQHLLDATVFSPDQIERTKNVLKRLRRGNDPLLEDEPYDYLGERVVDYYRHYGSKPHVQDPNLKR
jgi:hypothetical protein